MLPACSSILALKWALAPVETEGVSLKPDNFAWTVSAAATPAPRVIAQPVAISNKECPCLFFISQSPVVDGVRNPPGRFEHASEPAPRRFRLAGFRAGRRVLDARAHTVRRISLFRSRRK